jgi:hypothetical protein
MSPPVNRSNDRLSNLVLLGGITRKEYDARCERDIRIFSVVGAVLFVLAMSWCGVR